MDEPTLRALVRDVQDFPEPGIVFKDITPLLADPSAFEWVVATLAERFRDREVSKVAGVEARGFILAAPVARELGAGFVPIRKPGKLPGEVAREDYRMEYGADAVEVHRDTLGRGESVLLIDDVIATGGTLDAALRLLSGLGAHVAGVGALIELAFLGGRDSLTAVDVFSLLTYDTP